MKEFVLSNGVKIPAIGLGTYLTPNDEVADIICDAVKIGYRHIDSAQDYENEYGVGDGIKRCGLKREEIFVTTKVRSHFKDYQSAYDSVIESLKRLDLDYIDLVLIHCPEPWSEFRGPNSYFKENVEVWRALEDLYFAKKIRAIGVSNFLIEDLQNIFDHCRVKPMVNQFLLCAGITDYRLIDFCRENNIVIQAYSPIGHGRLVNDERLTELANKYKVSKARLAIKYTYDLDVVTLPKARSHEHLVDNFDMDFTLDEADLLYLYNLKD